VVPGVQRSAVSAGLRIHLRGTYWDPIGNCAVAVNTPAVGQDPAPDLRAFPRGSRTPFPVILNPTVGTKDLRASPPGNNGTHGTPVSNLDHCDLFRISCLGFGICL